MRPVKKYSLFVLIGVLLVVLVGCGNSIKLKSEDDRNFFSKEEQQAVKEIVKKQKGAIKLDIEEAETGYSATLYVDKGEYDKPLAIQTFKRLQAETNETLILFVKDSENNDVLFQGFKPSGKDDQNEWIDLTKNS